MSHEFETGFFVREPAWHKLGTVVADAPTSADALRLAGLDWNVLLEQAERKGKIVPNTFWTVRSSDDSVLGAVSGKYKIIQNDEAFNFTDNLLGEGVKYESAGSLKHGKTVWLLAKMPETKVLGDDFVPYLCFTNSHDGSGAIRVCLTDVRVVCNNTLNLALSTAKRSWSTKHMGDLNSKLMEASETLQLANQYMDAFKAEADILATQKISPAEIDKLLDELFGKEKAEESESKRKLQNVEEAKEAFYVCYLAPDLANFIGTYYGVINAMADMVDHRVPARLTENYAENNFARVIGGHPLLDATYDRLKSTISV